MNCGVAVAVAVYVAVSVAGSVAAIDVCIVKNANCFSSSTNVIDAHFDLQIFCFISVNESPMKGRTWRFIQ